MKLCYLVIGLIVALSALSSAQTTYYYDPTYTGGSNNGTQAHPYATYSTLWSAVNTALGSGNVIVYFSANVTDTNELDVSQCTATSCKTIGDSTISCSGTGRAYACSMTGSNFLLLDGISQINTGTHTVPSWAATSVSLAQCIEPVPSSTNPPSYNCAQNTASRFTISTSVPITGPTGGSSFSNCVYNFQIQGFSFSGTSGQSANLTYIGNLLFQYNEVTRTALGSGGPGTYIGPGQSGPCHTGATRPGGTDSGPDSVALQFNLIHDEWGETIYSGASTSDPFVANASCTSCQQFEAGTSGTNLQCGNGCNSNSTVCATPGTPASCSTGAHYRIIGNTIFGSAAWGGQGDGMDIKDGHSDLQIVNNQMWSGRYPNCAANSTCTSATNLYCFNNGVNSLVACTSDAQCTAPGKCQAGQDGRGMVIESCSLVDSNFVEAPGHDGIDIVDSWNNSVGRSSCRISNNVVVNVNSGQGHNNGLELEALNTSGLAQWSNTVYENNSIYNAGNNTFDSADGILINSGADSGTVLVENNIIHTAGTAIGLGPATASNNDCFNSGGTCTGTGTITTDPKFVSTATPYLDTNFKLTSGSGAIGAGLNLSGAFTNDYAGVTRTVPWDIGAFKFGTTPTVVAPTAPFFAWTQEILKRDDWKTVKLYAVQTTKQREDAHD